MDIAERVAKESYAKRLKVGSIIVKDDRIISLSWNGTPPKWDNNCEDDTGATKPEVYHSELNSILKLTRSNESGQGSTMFITHAPCLPCAKAIAGAHIKAVYYKNIYRDVSGIDFLRKCKVKVVKLS